MAWWIEAIVSCSAVISPAMAQEATGIIKIDSSVSGAEVYIDGQAAGQVPLTRYLPPGSHTIRVVADGYDPYVRKVDIIKDGVTPVTAALVRGQGTVEFQVEPFGALLSIDGREVGTVPLRLSGAQIPAGEHRYTLSAPNHEPINGSFSFQPGKNLFFSHALETSAGRFVVESTPPGAQVWLDGEAVGQTPLSLRDVPAGVHAVQINSAGVVAVRKVDTSDGSKGEVRVNLESGAKVNIKGAGDAQTQIEGVPLSFPVALARGSYRLEVTAPEAKSITYTLVVPDSGRLTLIAELVGVDDTGASTIALAPPLVGRWTFWTAIGVGAAGVGTGAALTARALTPEPDPTGDVVVILP